MRLTYCLAAFFSRCCLFKGDTYRASSWDDIQSRNQLTGNRVKIELDDGVTVLICNIAFAIRGKAEETRSFSETRIKSGILQITGMGINVIYSNAVSITVRYKDKFAARIDHDFAGIGIGGNGFWYGG